MDIPVETSETPSEALSARSIAPSKVRGLAQVLSWIVLAAAALIVAGLVAITIGPRFLPYQALVVRSGSMEPAIPTGSVVFYRHVKADHVKVGQVIVFSKPGEPSERITHRVYKIGTGPTGKYFITKGDANGAPDDWRVPAVGTGWVASFHVPTVGYVLADMQSTTARLLLLLIPAVLLGAITLVEIWRDRGTAKT